MPEMNFKDKIKKWSTIVGSEKKTFYDEQIFDDVLQRFTRNSKRLKGKYKTIISLVGFSPEPIILAINALAPEEVYFLITPETKDQIDLICAKTGLKASQTEKVHIASSDITEIYAAIKNILRRKEPKSVAIDITGGKKVMGAGAAVAGSFLECDMFYVDYEKYLPDGRTPYPGTEFLNFLPNPYSIFGDITEKRALELYNKGNYAAAVEILGQLQSKVPDPRPVEIKRLVMSVFQHWEEYQFDKADRCANQAIEKINKYRIYNELIEPLQQRLFVLNQIISDDARYIVLNHFYMAQVNLNRHKYDFAVLMLYRTLELLFSYQLLNKYHIDVSKPEYEKYPGLLEKFNAKIPKAFGANAKLSNNLPPKIGFMYGAILLAVFNDTLIKDIELDKLRKQADNRNKGILAHGSKPNTEKQFLAMQKEFMPIINRFVQIYFPKQKMENILLQYEPIEIKG